MQAGLLQPLFLRRGLVGHSNFLRLPIVFKFYCSYFFSVFVVSVFLLLWGWTMVEASTLFAAAGSYFFCLQFLISYRSLQCFYFLVAVFGRQSR
jgi:hypothetical protein